jgi:hypothetical protein
MLDGPLSAARLRVVLMHRPGDEVNVVDTSKRLDNRAFGDTQAGWYWRGVEGPDLAGMQAQHDAYAALLKKEGVEVVYRRDRRRPNEVLLHAGLLHSHRGRRNRDAIGPEDQARRRARGDAHPRETRMSHPSHGFG